MLLAGLFTEPIFLILLAVVILIAVLLISVVALSFARQRKKAAPPMKVVPDTTCAPQPETEDAAPASETPEMQEADSKEQDTKAEEEDMAKVKQVLAKSEPKEEKPKEKELEAASKSKVLGKYDFTLEPDGYHYCLLANNGQLLYESVGYTTYDGAKAGVDTFKSAVDTGKFRVRYDRGGKYSYVLNGKFYGEGYKNRSQCERVIESVKRFAPTKSYAEPEFSDEDMQIFKESKANLKNANSVAWERVAAEEEAIAKSGKFMIDPEEDGGASFTLLANNGACLYTSRLFSDVKSASGAIDAFKRAVYIGNFFVTHDKFGNYHFVLKGTGTNWYIGDSYAAKERCLSAIESVRKFVKSAEIVVNKNTFTEDSRS